MYVCVCVCVCVCACVRVFVPLWDAISVQFMPCAMSTVFYCVQGWFDYRFHHSRFPQLQDTAAHLSAVDLYVELRFLSFLYLDTR